MAAIEADFEPDKRTVEDLFVGPVYYVIPRFQRPYSWDKGNLDEFWRDVVYDNNLGYFIGPMVAWRVDGSSRRRVVDGQQRLTTIAIVFAVLRDELRELGESNLAEGIHRYLEKANRDNELEYTLKTEVEAPYLNRGIFLDPPDRDVRPQNEEEKALHQAYEQIRLLVSGEVEKRAEPVKWLTRVRDLVLGLRVIWVEHSNEDDAYIIFETLNSRGKDLEVVDLLKNLLFNKLRRKGNQQADVVRDRWNQMRGTIEGGNNSSLEVNRFILHWWLSREEYVAQRKLFRAMKARIKSRPLAQEALASLSGDAVLYRNALDPGSRDWPMEETKVRLSLEALADFRILQPTPLLLAILRARFIGEPSLKVAPLIATLQTIERYHFQYTVVSQLSSSGGVSEMYAKAARELYRCQENSGRAAVLKDIREKLVSRAPGKDQFVADFIDRFYLTDDYTRDSRLVRYVLRSFLRELQPTTGVDNLTVEHVLSQDQLGSGNEAYVAVGNIGNLLLVNDALNTRLANKPFSRKREILQEEGAAYDIGGILDKADWTYSEVVKRAEYLAELAYDRVWKLPV